MEALATRELEAKIAVGETYEVSQERSLIHNSWRTSKWKTTLSWQCCAGLLTPLHCIPCICWTFLSYGKFFVDSSAFWIPIRTHFLSLLPVSRLVSKCMHQNYVHKTRCVSTSHQTFSPTQLESKRTKCFLLISFLRFSKFIFLCNPRWCTVILSLWLLLTQWHSRLLKLRAQHLDGNIFFLFWWVFFFLMCLVYCWARQT